jgi:glycogen debranching enzyme
MRLSFVPVIVSLLMAQAGCQGNQQKAADKALAEQILANEYFAYTKARGLEVLKTGFNAGDGYREVWIRDYNTFIELAAIVQPESELRENLLVFFRMQGDDGNIIDGFTPRRQIGKGETDFSYSPLAPEYAGHKNTVETDQETSLVQAVYKYLKLTGDTAFLQEKVGDSTVAKRLEAAMDFLMNHRYSKAHGLIWGATTADWGDVRPEPGYGVDLDSTCHLAIDIYDNAMLVIALDNLVEMLPAMRAKWQPIRDTLAQNSRKHLWDSKAHKFIPHVYLNGSPFPKDFNENEIYYFGGTTVAIEAGLLSKEEVKASLDEMVKRVKEAGAPSIGLTLYPTYPDGYFQNQILTKPYTYQNGGDWTWFGGRMIQQLVKYGLVQEAYEQVQPMVKRVKDNKGFYEWYSIKNEPKGSGTFRGEAGVLWVAIQMLEEWARAKKGT